MFLKLNLLLLFHLPSFIICKYGECDKYDFDCNDVTETGKIDWSLNSLDQEDPKLIEIIKTQYLHPPAPKEVDYNFSHPLSDVNFNGQFGQPKIVDRQIFKNKLRKGFFIEAGAFDGESISNSVHFEVNRDWTGLLIEPNPDYFKKLLKKNRKAWAFGHCLSTQKTPEVIKFDAAGLYGGIEYNGRQPGQAVVNPELTSQFTRRTILMQCFPLYSILKALGNPTVHYLSLDIEGAELPVLQTIPFDKVDIKVLEIEANHIGQIFPGKAKELSDLIKRNGYKYYDTLTIDDVYIRGGFKIK